MIDVTKLLPTLAIMIFFLLAPGASNAQDCAKKLSNWNKASTFPAGVVDDYVACTEKTESELVALEGEIEALQKKLEAEMKALHKKRNAMITTLETSYGELADHYQSEDLDDKSDKYEKKRKDLAKKHKKSKL